MDNNSIVDATGNPLGGVNVGDGDYTSGETYTISKFADVNVTIGGNPKGSYQILPHTTLRVNYPNLNSGPLVVTSQDNLVSSIKVLFNGVSYSEMLGFPSSALTNEYWFPVYNSNTSLDSQLRVGNVGNQSTTITVYTGNNQQLDSFTLAKDTAIRKVYAGANAGPLHVVSSATNILTSVRYLYGGKSYSEELGYPGNQLTNEYWFPWYNNWAFSSELRVANTGSVPADVTVYIGNGQVLDSYTVAVGTVLRKSYAGKNNGPLRVVTTTPSATILPSIKVLFNTVSYSEMLGLPTAKLTNEYWLPVYDNVTNDSQIRVGNVGDQSTTVAVYLGNGNLLEQFTLAAGGAVRKNYANKNNGPLHIISDTTNVLVSVRNLYTTTGFQSYYEALGYPNSKLTTEYVFPWYNNWAFSSELRVAGP
jgi:hypothetical protein